MSCGCVDAFIKQSTVLHTFGEGWIEIKRGEGQDFGVLVSTTYTTNPFCPSLTGLLTTYTEK